MLRHGLRRALQALIAHAANLLDEGIDAAQPAGVGQRARRVGGEFPHNTFDSDGTVRRRTIGWLLDYESTIESSPVS